jgi:hypothetical protein
MKRILLLALGLTASTGLFAQNVLKDTGSVGVGTLVPTAKLEVYDGHLKISNDAAPATLILAGDRANIGDTGQIDTRISFLTDGTSGAGWYFDGLNYSGAGQMQFNYTASGVSKSIMSLGDGTSTGQGRIGIGTITPGAATGVDTKLHIFGTGANASGRTELRVENSSTTAGARVGSVNNSGSSIAIESFGSAYVSALAGLQAVHATKSLLLIGSDVSASGGTGNISFRPGGYDAPAETVIFTASGNVGIGTSTPAEKLAVKGKIHAQEVKVDIDAANWPDYVFSKFYKSLSLAEVEKFILLNNHLPEVPSADQVKSEGIAVGEMNAKLLKKIEELTLYMIDMDKKINRLENQNTKLRQTQGAKN